MAHTGVQVATQANGTKGEYDVLWVHAGQLGKGEYDVLWVHAGQLGKGEYDVLWVHAGQLGKVCRLYWRRYLTVVNQTHMHLRA